MANLLGFIVTYDVSVLMEQNLQLYVTFDHIKFWRLHSAHCIIIQLVRLNHFIQAVVYYYSVFEVDLIAYVRGLKTPSCVVDNVPRSTGSAGALACPHV